jgi:hypothetical protein
MQRWMYLRLAVSFRGEDEVFSATSNGTPIFDKETKSKAIDLQEYIEREAGRSGLGTRQCVPGQSTL